MSEWSQTSLSAYLRCGEAYRRRFIERDPTPGTLRMKRGTAVHAVAREANLRKLAALRERLRGPEANAALPSLEEAADLAATAFEREMDEGATITSVEDTDRHRSKDFAVRLGVMYVRQLAPHLEPSAVEQKVEVRPQGSDLVIHGTMDLNALEAIETERGTEVVEVIRDLKTAEKSPAKTAARDSQQLSTYAMLYFAKHGRLPHALALDHLIQTPEQRMERYVLQETRRDLRDVSAILARFESAARGVEAGIFQPAQPGMAWWCSAAWCPFWTTCRFVNGERDR